MKNHININFEEIFKKEYNESKLKQKISFDEFMDFYKNSNITVSGVFLKKYGIAVDIEKSKKPKFRELTKLTSKSAEELSQLVSLYLSNNNLTTIPKELGNLSQLKRLYIYNNKLSTIPKELGNLSQLVSLDLSSNNLTSIPKELGQSSQLMRLHLYNNNLTTIPKELGDLQQLEELYLRGNPLPQQEVDKIREMLPNCKVLF